MSSGTAPDHSSRVRLLLFFCRLELPLWFLSGIPSLLALAAAVVIAIVLGGATQRLLVFALSVVVCLGVLAVGSLFDAMRRLFRPRAEKLPATLSARLQPLLDELRSRGLIVKPGALRVVKPDISLAAHVNGVFSPKIVMSGGMLVGLLRGDATARAILAHEAAHISHFDRMLPTMIMVVIGNILLMPLAMAQAVGRGASLSWKGFVGIPVTVVFLSVVSRRREYMADLHAAYAIGSTRGYLDVLGAGRERGAGGFFHPEMNSRVDAISGQRLCKILRPSILWLAWWLGTIGLGLTTLLDGADTVALLGAGAQVVVGVLGMGIELAKPIISRPVRADVQRREGGDSDLLHHETELDQPGEKRAIAGI